MPTDAATGLSYVDNKTTYFGFELPYSENKLIIDVKRLINTFNAIDGVFKSLSTVAWSGKYGDLLEIVSQVQADWNATSGLAQIKNRPTLEKVATSGQYTDLKNTPDLEALKKDILLAAHPVLSYYWSDDPTSPADLFGGTWERIQGKFLYAADDTYGAGATGGNATTTLTVANLPAHNHNVTVSSAGAHTHTRGSQNITGEFATSRAANYYTGVFARTASGKYSNRQDASDGHYVSFTASKNWTGESSSAGAHGHTATCENTGNGTAFSNLPPLRGAYCWQRIK